MDLFKKKQKKKGPTIRPPEEPMGIAGDSGGLPPAPKMEERSSMTMPTMKAAPMDMPASMRPDTEAIKEQVGQFEDDTGLDIPLPQTEYEPEESEYQPEEYAQPPEKSGGSFEVEDAPPADFSFLAAEPPMKEEAESKDMIETVAEGVKKELEDKIKLLEKMVMIFYLDLGVMIKSLAVKEMILLIQVQVRIELMETMVMIQ